MCPNDDLMKTLVIIGALILAGTAWDQNVSGNRNNQPAMRIFDSADGTFRFSYPQLLIHCEQRPQGAGGGQYWIDEACTGYGGVCDEPAETDYTTIVCFAYPRNEYTNTPAFEAAAFSIGLVGQDTNEKECLAGSSNWNVEQRGIAKLGGATFHFFKTSSAGMSQGIDQEIYRTFHDGKCYQLAIAIAVANPKVFDPTAKSLTKREWNQVQHSLEQARDSFVFLR